VEGTSPVIPEPYKVRWVRLTRSPMAECIEDPEKSIKPRVSC